MIKEDLHIKMFANCIPVKGNNRSAICDLQRHDIKLIPNDLYKILALPITNINKIKATYNNEFDTIIDDYFDFLVKHEFAFTTTQPEIFPKLNTQWFEPAIINNAVLDYNKDSSYNFLDTLNQLDKFNCKDIQIRFYHKTEIDKVVEIIKFLDKNELFITSVDFVLPFSEDIATSDLTNLIKKHKRINAFIIHNSKENKFIEPINEFERGYIYYSTENIKNQKYCGKISSNFFSPNIKNYTESLQHNSCLNRKISIDTNGNIKNCPSMPQSFGNIKDTTLEEALNHKNFKKYWNITKDQIDVCKDCEFRYVCTDCRAYVEKPDDILSKPLKCGYNPYTNEWSEWSTNPLKQKAIEFYGMQELVKKDA